MFNLFRYAFKNIIRNPFISLSSLIVIGLLLFFIIILGFSLYGTDKFIDYVNGRLHIMVTLEDGQTETTGRVTSLLTELRERFAGLSVQYIGQEEALRTFQSRDPELANLIEGVDQNPLPNVIRLSNIPFASYEAIQTTIENYKDILKYDQVKFDQKFLDFRSQYLRTSKLVSNLILLKEAVWTILILFVFTVFVVVYTVISNTIFFLRDEMAIIELVGGRSYFIYGPLVIQGMVYTGSAAILALGLFFWLRYLIPPDAFSGAVQWAMTEFATLMSPYILPAVVGAILLGALSAFVASWKYVHKTIG